MTQLQFNGSLKSVAIAVGTGVFLTVSALVYWYFSRQDGCVQTLSTGGQEVVYRWGCSNPQQFRQWSVIATAQAER